MVKRNGAWLLRIAGYFGIALALSLPLSTKAFAACVSGDYFCEFSSQDGLSNSNVASSWSLGPKHGSASNVRIFRTTVSTTYPGCPPVGIGACSGGWQLLASNISNNSTQYLDTGAQTGAQRSYILCFDWFQGSWQTSCSPTGGGTQMLSDTGWRAPPPVPTNLNATDGTSTSTVTVSWAGTLPSSAKYKLFRSSSGSICSDTDALYEGTLTSYTDSQAIPGITYQYSIASKAPNGSLSSCYIEQDGTGWRKMSPPTNVQAQAINTSTIQVLWNSPNQTPQNGVVNYLLYRRDGSGSNVCGGGQQLATLLWSQTTFNDNSALPGHTYYYALESIGQNGYPSNCSVVSGAAALAGYSISGHISRATDGAALPGVSVKLNGAVAGSSDAAGNYTLSQLGAGTYNVSASLPSLLLTPANQIISINSASVSGVNFSASCASGYHWEGLECVATLVSPIEPKLECIIEQPGAGFVALFRYNNQNSGSYALPVGSTPAGVNSFSPAPIGRGQPTVFSPGLSADAFAVPFDGSPLTWTIDAGFTGPLSVTASSASPRCAAVQPTAQCVSITASGTLQAHFGFVNPNVVSIPAGIGALNSVSPAPVDRGQPTVFAPGTQLTAFTTEFSLPSVTWNLFGLSATVDVNTPVCAPGNHAPVANAGGSYAQACGGALTQIPLSAATSSDQDGNVLFYSWSTTCANASFSNPLSKTPLLILSNPGAGIEAACTVSVTVSDGLASSSAAATISVPACNLDCLGMPNGSAALDVCGVCNGDGSTCLDCAGVPQGSALVDQCGVCGGNNSCLDCNGVPNGPAAHDRCGICGGNGESCLGCVSTSISQLTQAVSDDFFVLRDLTARALRRLRDASSAKKKIRKWAVGQLKKFDFRYQKFGLDLYAQLPAIIVSCSNADFCTTVDNKALLDSYRVYADSLNLSAQTAFKKIGKVTKRTSTDKKRRKKTQAFRDLVQSQINQIPQTGSKCQ